MWQEKRVRGLDTIRAILACWVAISHIGLFPLLEGVDASSEAGGILKGLYGVSVNGPAAVITFFLISGFCIHYPYRDGVRLRLLQYYPRRYLRILAPLGAAVVVAHFTGGDIYSVLWSIVCEEIYYFIYPALLVLRRKVGWGWLLAFAFAASLGVAWTAPAARDYWSPGWGWTWLLGLPCWLLGCKLAERSDTLLGPVSGRTVWAWRVLVWAASCCCIGLRFHSPIGYPHTLNYFAVLAYFWLQREIAYFRVVRPPPLLEWSGKWSYSLYLMHIPANGAYDRIPMPHLGFILGWLFRFGWSLGCSYAFYLLVERPSHSLARRLGGFAARGKQNSGDGTTRQGEKAVPRVENHEPEASSAAAGGKQTCS